MMNTLRSALELRLIHALHMILPLSFALWHMGRLSPRTLASLRAMFG